VSFFSPSSVTVPLTPQHPIDDLLTELETAYDAEVVLRLVRLYEEIGEMSAEEAARWRERLVEWKRGRPPLPRD